LTSELNPVVAISNGHIDTVKYLHQNGWNIKNSNYAREAAYRGYVNILKYLYHYDKKLLNYEPHLRAGDAGQLEVLKYLHELGADLEINDNYIINISARRGELAIVKYLIEEIKINVNIDKLISKAMNPSTTLEYLQQIKM
jgi:ankyrin repeat protein